MSRTLNALKHLSTNFLSTKNSFFESPVPTTNLYGCTRGGDDESLVRSEMGLTKLGVSDKYHFLDCSRAYLLVRPFVLKTFHSFVCHGS